MLNFKEYVDLIERVLSPGFNPEHEHHREKHRQEIHDILQKSYEKVDGGYGGRGSGSKAESDAIHDDISNSAIKMVKRDGKISAVSLYKKQYGRKGIAMGTDGTEQGKKDAMSIMRDDKKKERSWGEVSGAPEHLKKKMGFPPVPASKAAKLTGKSDVDVEDENYYTRKLGNERHRKRIMGFPKEE